MFHEHCHGHMSFMTYYNDNRKKKNLSLLYLITHGNLLSKTLSLESHGFTSSRNRGETQVLGVSYPSPPPPGVI